jgi:signal transduction histidine kinase
MFRTGLAMTFAAGMISASATFAAAQQFGTADEAKAMLGRAVTEMKANEAAAIAKFSDKENKDFRDRDLYVFCFRMSDGVFTVHPNPAVNGTDVRNLKVKDDLLGQKLFDAAKEGSVASVNYNFPKPGTTDPVPKESFVTRIGAQSCAVGYYK